MILVNNKVDEDIYNFYHFTTMNLMNSVLNEINLRKFNQSVTTIFMAETLF